MRALFAALLIVACGPTTPEAEDFCVSEANTYRVKQARDPVEHSSTLASFAKEGAKIDFTEGALTHFGIDGGGVALAENQCPQQDGWTVAAGEDEDTVIAQCIRSFYDEAPGGPHYANLMGPYAKLGCGTYQSEGKITIVLDFGEAVEQ